MLSKYRYQHVAKYCVLLVGITICTWLPQRTIAGEFAYGIGYVGEYSDNIRLAPSNGQHEWINTATLGVAYQERGPSLLANMTLEAQYLDYHNDTYGDGPRYYANAAALWAISPQRFHWVLIDRAEQTILNSSLQATPDNLTNTNVVSTGPDFFLRLGSVNTLALEARYGRASYEVGETSNNRYSGATRWLYTANSNMTYSANYEYLQVVYDNDVLNENYRRHDAYLRSDYHQANTVILLDAGATKIYKERGGEISGPTFRLTATQRITPESTAGIHLASEFLDPSMSLLGTAVSPNLDVLSTPAMPVTHDAVGDIYNTKRADIFYNRTGTDIGFGMTIYYREIDYDVTPLDRVETGGYTDLTLNPSGLFSTSVYGSYQYIRYQNVVRDDQDTQIGIRMAYRMTRNLSSTLDVHRFWRNSTDPIQEYVDHRLLVSLIYVSNPMLSPIRR